jgi:4-phospho-D-threonate 3-dehydrogenase / 4-phospho-D-erythronate 3-dehydrogenase
MNGTTAQLPCIGITMGDPVGIGPEIIIKALAHAEVFSWCRPVVFGDRAILQREIDRRPSGCALHDIDLRRPAEISPSSIGLVAVSRLSAGDAVYGMPTTATGKAMAACITEAVSRATDGQIHAIVTAPISKASLHQAGYAYPGHTEMLARLTNAREVAMMLAGERLRVVPVTVHCALREVSGCLSTGAIVQTIRMAHRGLQRYFSLTRPRIAVAALNPHGGEGGLFGDEESRVILPAVHQARAQGFAATGPHPPDTVFYQAARGEHDAVVCMYHDQGLIPLKLLHFEDAVNVTLGLPIIRTSVDHGTAYDIAGRGVASPASLLSALQLASRMALADGARA